MLRRHLIWMCSKTDWFQLGASTAFKAHISLIHASDTKSRVLWELILKLHLTEKLIFISFI